MAEEIFTKITKAYEELTYELPVASSNCELTVTLRFFWGLIILPTIAARGSTSSFSKEEIEDGVRPVTDSNTPSLDVAINPSE